MLPASLFHTIELKLNQKPEPNLTSYLSNYKSIIEAYLSVNQTAAKTHWRRAIFIPDGDGMFADMTPHPVVAEALKKLADARAVVQAAPAEGEGGAAVNVQAAERAPAGEDSELVKTFKGLINNSGIQRFSGYTVRSDIVRNSKFFDFSVPFPHEFARLDRYLVPGLSYEFKCTRTPDNFLIKSPEANAGYKLEIHDLKLWYKFHQLQPKLCVDIERTLVSSVARYPHIKSEIKQNLIPVNSKDFQWEAVFSGYLPKQIIFAMVSHKAYNGSYGMNPYRFQHFNTNKFYIKIDNRIFPLEGYAPDFENGLYMREFDALYSTLGVQKDNDGNMVTYQNFKDGCFFLPFDLSPDGCNGFHMHVPIKGVVSLEMGFSKETTETVTILAYAAYDTEMRVDGHRKIETFGFI
jgi:hypothetical protein